MLSLLLHRLKILGINGHGSLTAEAPVENIIFADEEVGQGFCFEVEWVVGLGFNLFLRKKSDLIYLLWLYLLFEFKV